MTLAKTISSWLVSMFLIAPSARGDSADAHSTFIRSVSAACRETLSEKLGDRQRLAAALCEDDRILWPFAESLYGAQAVQHEDRFRSRHHFGPLVIGLIGVPPREVRWVANAIRTTLYPLSNSLFPWTGERDKLRQWQSHFSGGRFGGILLLEMDKDGVQGALDALNFTLAHHMDSYVLVLSSPRDVRAQFPKTSDPIKWIPFDSTDCGRKLSSL